MKSGEPYYANDLSQMTSDYSSSDWFSSVLVEPHLNEKEKVVDLNVLFQPKKKMTWKSVLVSQPMWVLVFS
ncbi:outer membrane protein and surface antigen [Actinobacillus equuli]|nr:outer membrane protein and surface antigen [Actinobacillus equuli]